MPEIIEYTRITHCEACHRTSAMSVMKGVGFEVPMPTAAECDECGWVNEVKGGA